MVKYSIILPVRNGGEYVKECIHSILNQTYSGWQLHVLDNSSTDQTVEWINSLADPRILVFPSDKPLSIEENWSRIRKIQKNEYCTLIGHDDLLNNYFLEEMEQLIARCPEASLYTSHFRYIDATGNLIRSCKPIEKKYDPADFLTSFLESKIDSMGSGFMMRSADYDSVGGIPCHYPNLLFADFELWINLARLSYVVSTPKECFAFRLHQSMTTTSSDLKLKMAFFIFNDYLYELKKQDALLADAIEAHGLAFIQFYCKSLSHRLLRTPLGKRDNLTVSEFMAACKHHADLLCPGNNWNPVNTTGVRMAKIIDGNPILRSLFLLFKRFYKKPLYS